MAGYAEQLLVCTGQDDWVSRVEEENGGENLVADVKELIGRGGPYADPWHNVPLTNASFPPTVPTGQVARGLRDTQTTSAYVLPSFKYVPVISRDAVEALVKGFLLPERLNHAHKGLSQLHKDQLTRHEGFQGEFPGVRDVEDVLVLICGHGGRDVRCGVLGPLLQEEFEKNIPAAAGLELLQGAVSLEAGEKSKDLGVRVGLCSHIGGHKFAGNVIIYVPPRAKLPSGEQHPLRGMGIWYGRVEPKHVEGIVRETLVGGKVIQEFFRGGVQKDKGILRL
jgi:(2Fe-2S) ferredoxin